MTWTLKGERELYEASSRCWHAGLTSNSKSNRAIKRGDLKSCRGAACADCGRIAKVNEHRDYDKWWDIEPACRSCNVKRGRAAPFRHVPHRRDRVSACASRHTPFVGQFALSMLEATTEPFE